MAVNQFLTFALGGSANVLSPAAYAALTTLINNGYQSGTANSVQMNTTWRQSAFLAAAFGEIVKSSGRDALDDGNLSAYVTKILDSLTDLIAFRGAPGSLLEFCGTGTPPGRWILANGALLLRVGTYATLFGQIGTTWNTGGEDSDHFRIPDYRGVFRRGLDIGRGIDTGRAFGPVLQLSENKAHYHLLPQVGDASCINQYLYGSTDISPTLIATLDNKSSNTTIAARASNGAESGGAEARPTNLPVRVFIGY